MNGIHEVVGSIPIRSTPLEPRIEPSSGAFTLPSGYVSACSANILQTSARFSGYFSCLVGLGMKASSCSANSSCSEGITCEYVSRVSVMDECPSRSWTTLG